MYNLIKVELKTILCGIERTSLWLELLRIHQQC